MEFGPIERIQTLIANVVFGSFLPGFPNESSVKCLGWRYIDYIS